MTLEELQKSDSIVFECYSGSHAQGLATPTSDVDIKGVFILPEDDYFGLDYIDQISNETNDIVYYELRRFVELLSQSNPNILELLYTPKESIRILHPCFKPLLDTKVLSKLCKEKFGNYAYQQIRKAKGLNKKILNPMSKKRKSILDFCFVVHDQGSISALEFLSMNKLTQSACGLTKVPHMTDVYGIYMGNEGCKEMLKKEDSNEFSLSTIPKGELPIGIMHFNHPAYSKYCKDYKEYWKWVKERNEVRFASTTHHGKGYDAKNMMQCLRLLNMCEEIGETGKLIVKRNDRAFLLDIKNGKYEYQSLIQMAEDKLKSIEETYQNCDLPNILDKKSLNAVLVQVRKDFHYRY